MTPRKHYRAGPDVDLEREDVRDAKGARIDEKYVRDAVDRAHEYMERKGLAGRPSLTAPGKRSPQVAVRLPEMLHAAAEAHARREGKSMSAVLREALEQYLRAS